MTPLSPEVQAELAKLHDIHLPAPIGWWPLAPGWWGLAAILLVALMVLTAAWAGRGKSRRRLALEELAQLRERAAQGADPALIAPDLAVLLRRVALGGSGGRALGALSGEAWEKVLSEGPGGLSEPVAKFVADAPYVPRPFAGAASREAGVLMTEALQQSRHWIRRQA